MRIRLFCLATLVALGATSISAQSSVLPDQAGAWLATGPAKMLRANDLGSNWSPRPNAQAVLKESGLSRVEERTYRHGSDEATLRTFVLNSPTSAYELYTYLISPGMRGVDLADGAAAGENRTYILAGNLVVEASLTGNAKPENLADLAEAVKSKADATPFPPLRGYLPAHWLVFGSQKYALGPEALRDAMASLDQNGYQPIVDEIGFQDDAEAILARYQGEKGGGVLLLVLYPTPQVAENRLHHLEQAIRSAAKDASVNVERKASMLSLVFGATSPTHAQAIRDEVNYETEVTWNEPSTTATDPPLVLVLFKIFLFTSLFLVVATIAGMFFGVVRLLIKHWLPGKVFDRPQDIEVLQLGLTSKKIDPTDMY